MSSLQRTSSIISVSSEDYKADDESYEKIEKELPNLIEKGNISGEIEGSSDDEVPALYPKGQTAEEEVPLTQQEQDEVETKVEEAVEELEIIIEDVVEQQPRRSTRDGVNAS